MAEKNRDVRVTAWDSTPTFISTTGKTKTGWAGIFSNNQDIVKVSAKDPLGTAPPVVPAPPKEKSKRGGARVKTTGTVLFQATGSRSKVPGAAASATDSADTQSLPSGWFTAVDKSTGNPYYYNDKGETTWDLPKD